MKKLPQSSIELSSAQSTFLDLLRGFSAQIVVIGHALWASGHPIKITLQDLGVVMFFLLSGFLVTISAMRRGDFTVFLIDRFARMFTPYIPCLGLIWIAGMVLRLGGAYDVLTFACNALMLQDFPLHRFIGWAPEIERLGTGRPLWSVAMEWWFYLAFGGFFFSGSLPRWSLPLVAAGVFIAAFNMTVGMLFYTWLAGAMAALLWLRLTRAPWKLLFIAFLVLATYRYKITPDEFYDLRLDLLLAAVVFTALKCLENGSAPRWLARLGGGLAAYSYTLYLTHYTVLAALSQLDGWFRVAAVFLLSNAIAVPLYFAFERHYKKVATHLKLRLQRSAERTAVAKAA